jgi:hypothetical protein
MSAYESGIVEKRAGEFFLVSAWSLLDVADIGFCRFPLSPPLPHVIRIYDCHLKNTVTLLVHYPAIQFFD